jgi:hypothetical protein
LENENSEELLIRLLLAWVKAQTALGKSGLAPLLGYEENPYLPITLGKNPKHDYRTNART